MKIASSDALATIGYMAIIAGVYLEFGTNLSLIVGGSIPLAMAAVGEMRRGN